MMGPLRRSAKNNRGLARKVHEGEIFSGIVTRIIPIGAFVEILLEENGSYFSTFKARVEG